MFRVESHNGNVPSVPGFRPPVFVPVFQNGMIPKTQRRKDGLPSHEESHNAEGKIIYVHLKRRQSAVGNQQSAKDKATAKASTSYSSITLLAEPDFIAILKSRAGYYLKLILKKCKKLNHRGHRDGNPLLEIREERAESSKIHLTTSPHDFHLTTMEMGADGMPLATTTS